ncbi:MAG: phycobilisome linker polypeptide [Phormidesmis sp.]
MLGQYAASGASSTDSRIFVYEVAGLSENEVTAQIQAPIRSSHTQLRQVPFSRMNEEMRRITMLGGEIINIRPLNSPADPAEESEQDSAEDAEA